MADTITVSGTSKDEKYASLLPQLKSLAEEPDQYAALGNIISALKYGMGFFWAGLYIVKNNELVLGPFQGTVACTRIGFGKGVCGYAWKEQKTVIVDDVNTFAGHIACSTESKSEIVLPVFAKNGEVLMVLDIDSDRLADFNSTDKLWLTETVHIIERIVKTED
jgi:L-methionine (R)-S-oxide reductase